ncbi:hypothetical protein CTKA_01371 [Chthonomonas calidirosea]|uniref:Uncharacterized protein n=1 Tax=Chthonomonas calidirosea (strain DSM 23976 / ICMP 18418 / T49) TaxID=1303518 RepID=S0F050_CHTCT|nr:hypothetical protein CCALI_02719 [Chthonomonas calidirosea T49]CEK17129.1 hypothetical protein CTKA_01371 [Chthonomonas calidirosea]
MHPTPFFAKNTSTLTSEPEIHAVILVDSPSVKPQLCQKGDGLIVPMLLQIREGPRGVRRPRRCLYCPELNCCRKSIGSVVGALQA